MKHWFSKSLAVVLSLSFLLSGIAFPMWASAASSRIDVPGKVFEFDKDNDYKFSEATGYKGSDSSTTYGHFSIIGNATTPQPIGKKDGVAAYSVKEGTVSISYTYSSQLLNAADDKWHLIADKEKNVDIYKLMAMQQLQAMSQRFYFTTHFL